MTDRERFESIISASPYEKSVARWPNLPVKFAWPGGYKDLNVDLAWHMWQASRKQALEEALEELQSQSANGGRWLSTDAELILYRIGADSCINAVRSLANPEGEQG